MRTRVDASLARDAVSLAFRFACDDCAHWTGRACANGYPLPLRPDALQPGAEVSFCKEFELGRPVDEDPV